MLPSICHLSWFWHCCIPIRDPALWSTWLLWVCPVVCLPLAEGMHSWLFLHLGVCNCYDTSFSILSPFHIMCSITWSAVSLIQHCCAMPHGYHRLLRNASLITHVEHSGTTYIRISQNASLLTHVLQLVYIVRSLDCNLSRILLSYPL